MKARLLSDPAKMSASERHVFECAFAVAFVGFYQQALKRRLLRPGEYACVKASDVAIEAAHQLRENNLG
jgi:hypothetical protein